MPDYIVSVSFTGKDKGISATFAKIDRSADKMGDSVSRSFKKAAKSATNFRSSFKAIMAAGAVQRGLGFLQQGVSAVTRQFIDFDDAIFGATARFTDAQEEGANVGKIMESLRMAARKTGAETQFTAAQAAQGLDFFARAGFRSQEAIGSLRSVIDLTTATGEDFARVADISSDLLGAFGGASLESSKKIAFLKEMNASLALATNSANVTMEDLFETLKIAAPVGTAAGASMKEMIAVTAVLGGTGIKGSMAATALKNSFTRLVAPTKEVRDGLFRLGLSTTDFVDKEGNLISMTKIMGMIGKNAKDLGKAEKLALFSKIFGARAVAGAVNLESNIDGVFKSMEKLSKDPQAKLAQLSNFMRQSLGNQLKTLASAATELGFKFLSAFAGEGGKGIESLTKAIAEFDPKPIVDTLKLVFSFAKGIFNFVKPLLGIMPLVVKGWIAWKVVQIASLGVQKATLAIGWIQYLWQMRSAIMAAVTAQRGLNLAMRLNPIGFVITAIIALVGVIKYLGDNWDLVTEQWRLGWRMFLGFIDLAKVRLFEFLSTIPLIGEKFKDSLTKARIDLVVSNKLVQKSFQDVKRLEDQPREKFLGLVEANRLTKAEAPNKTEVERQALNVSGTIGVSGPPGTTVEKSKKTAPGINFELLGAS